MFYTKKLLGRTKSGAPAEEPPQEDSDGDAFADCPEVRQGAVQIRGAARHAAGTV